MYPSGSGAERFGMAASGAASAAARVAAALSASATCRRSLSACSAQTSVGTGGGAFLLAAGDPLRKGLSGTPCGGPVCGIVGGGALSGGGVGGCGTEGCHGENLGGGDEEDEDAVPPWPALTYPGKPGGGPVGGVGAGRFGGPALTPGGGVGGAFTPPFILCCSEGGGALKPAGAVITQELAVSCSSNRQTHAVYAGT